MPVRRCGAGARVLPSLILLISGLPSACAGDEFTASRGIATDASVPGDSSLPKNSPLVVPADEPSAATESAPQVSTSPTANPEPDGNTEPPSVETPTAPAPEPPDAQMARVSDAGLVAAPRQQPAELPIPTPVADAGAVETTPRQEPTTDPGMEPTPDPAQLSRLAADVAGVLDGYRLDLPCADGDSPDAGSGGLCPLTPEDDRQRHVLALGGNPNVAYAVELNVRGVAEVIDYVEFDEQLARRTVLGGTTADLTASSFSMSVGDPRNTYFLNHRGGGGPFSPINDTFTIFVQGRTRLILSVSGPPSTPDGQQRSNAEGRTVRGDDLGPQPYRGQFLQFDVLSVAERGVLLPVTAGASVLGGRLVPIRTSE